jgi:hypothetical protein
VDKQNLAKELVKLSTSADGVVERVITKVDTKNAAKQILNTL